MATTGFQVNGSDVSNYFASRDNFTSGQLWVWGQNSNYGQLGTNNLSKYSSPVQTVAGGTNWKQVAGGGIGTNAAGIKTDGSLWVWGYNGGGDLGTNNLTHYSSPVQTIAGGTNWRQVAVGGDRMAAIKTDGTLWVWGDNSFGALGDGTTTGRSSPVQTIAGGYNWKQVSNGDSSFTIAIKTNGTLWGWGYNGQGMLGTNNTTNYSSPVQTIAAGTNWKLVSAKGGSVAAIKTDGTLWTWGQNNYGQLGTNNTTNYSSPVQTIAAGTNWKYCVMGNITAAGIKTDGTLWMWGQNGAGSLGTNDTTNYSSPVQTVAGGTNWKQITLDNHSIAIKTDGTLWVWGDNTWGQLGTNDQTNYSSPVQTVAGGSNWKQVSSVYGGVYALNNMS